MDKKLVIFIIPSTTHPIIRFVVWLTLRTPSTFSLLILSALTPSKYEVRTFNQKLFWLKKDFVKNALVGISCSTSNSSEAYKLGDRFRKSGSTVIMGGTHASYYPEEVLLHSDSVVIGEAESVWQQVLDDYENKALKKVYNGTPQDDYFSPVYSYFMDINPRILYRSGILLSRGCKYHCEFCARPFGKLRFIKIEQAINLIKRAKGFRKPFFRHNPALTFKDDNIFSDPNYAKRLFKELINLELKWVGNSSIDIAFDKEALALAKASGCQELFIGFETIYPDKFQKTSVSGIRSTNDYIKAIKQIKSYGIKVTGGFIIGFDYYTHKDYFKLIIFLLKSGLYLISLTILTPFPGSQLFDKLKKEDRITTFDWRKYDSLQHVVFKPKNMPAWTLQLWFIIIRIISLLISPLYIKLLLKGFIAFLIPYFLVFYLYNRLFY